MSLTKSTQFLPIHFAAMTGDNEMVQQFLDGKEEEVVSHQLLAGDTPGVGVCPLRA